jgi:hypothetical protein
MRMKGKRRMARMRKKLSPMKEMNKGKKLRKRNRK